MARDCFAPARAFAEARWTAYFQAANARAPQVFLIQLIPRVNSMVVCICIRAASAHVFKHLEGSFHFRRKFRPRPSTSDVLRRSSCSSTHMFHARRRLRSNIRRCT